MVTDPIADFIIRLKNGSDAKKPTVEVPFSKFAENVAYAYTMPERVGDFFYFNDFYIVALLVIIMLLYVIFYV